MEGSTGGAGQPSVRRLVAAVACTAVPIGLHLERLGAFEAAAWGRRTGALLLLVLALVLRPGAFPAVLGLVGFWGATVGFGGFFIGSWVALEAVLTLCWVAVWGAAGARRWLPTVDQARVALPPLLVSSWALAVQPYFRLPFGAALVGLLALGVALVAPSAADVAGRGMARPWGMVRSRLRRPVPERPSRWGWSAAVQRAVEIGPMPLRRPCWSAILLGAVPFTARSVRVDTPFPITDEAMVVTSVLVWALALGAIRPPWFGPIDRRWFRPAVWMVSWSAVILQVDDGFYHPLSLALAAFALAVLALMDRGGVREFALDLGPVTWPLVVIGRLLRSTLGRLVRPLRTIFDRLARVDPTVPVESDPDRESTSLTPRRGPTDLVAWARQDGFRVPLAIWAVLAVLVNWTLGVMDRTVRGFREIGPSELSGLVLLKDGWRSWSGWDSGFYRDIAVDGYSWVPGQQHGTTVPLFPLYPLLMRWGSHLFRSPILAGIVVTVISGMAVALLFWWWLRQRGLSSAARTTALLLLLVYPWSFMLYGAVYADVLALALVLGAFVLVEADRRVLAGLVGALATASKPNVLPVMVGLVVLVLERDGVLSWRALGPAPATSEASSPDRSGGDGRPRWDWALDLRQLRPSQAGVLLSVSGIAAYAWYCQVRFGDALLFYRVQHYWGHGPFLSAQTWLKVDYLQDFWRLGNGRGNDVNALAAACVVVGTAALVPAIARRHGLGYGAFTAGVVASTLAGAVIFTPGGRHLMVAFPAFALAGEWLAPRPRLRRLVLGASLLAMLALTSMWARSTPDIGW